MNRRGTSVLECLSFALSMFSNSMHMLPHDFFFTATQPQNHHHLLSHTYTHQSNKTNLDYSSDHFLNSMHLQCDVGSFIITPFPLSETRHACYINFYGIFFVFNNCFFIGNLVYLDDSQNKNKYQKVLTCQCLLKQKVDNLDPNVGIR